MVMVKGVRSVELSGSVQLLYPRLPWHLWKQGWHRHRDGLGESCWIRFNVSCPRSLMDQASAF